MSTCGDNVNLDKLKELQGGLDSKLQGGKDQLASLKTDMLSMKAEAESFKPTIPTKESFQQELQDLAAQNENVIAFEAKKALLKSKYTSAEADFDATLEKLGMSTFPPTQADINTICANAANVVLDEAGNAIVEPEPPKVADVVPPPPVPKAVYVPDVEEINKDLIKFASRMTFNRIKFLTDRLFAFGQKKRKQEYYELSGPEVWIYTFESGGANIDEVKKFNYTVADLRSRQAALKQKRPTNAETDAYDFQAQGKLIEENYNKYKAEYSSYANAGPFAQACTEYVARYKKKNGIT